MPTLSPGQLLGRYRIDALLGAGGMGEVYRAHDTILRRPIAVKVLLPDLRADTPERAEAQRARFLREARAAAGLRHPGIVTIFDVGEIGETPYIAMELVEGTPLRALRGEDVLLARKLRWLGHIAGALAAAHRAGLIHRDIKPDNVMVCADDAIRILDFGVAKVTEGEAPSDGGRVEDAPSFRTGAGSVVGTPRYMAPEQAAGLAVDARADEFAWGLVAYELLTGVRAGDAQPAFTREGAWAAAAEPIDRRCPDLPPRVAEVVMHALERRAEARFASMDEVVAAFAEYVPAASAASASAPPAPAPANDADRARRDISAGSTVSAPPTLVAAPEARAPKRARGAQVAIFVGGLAALGGAAFFATRPWQATPIAPTTPSSSTTLSAPTPPASPSSSSTLVAVAVAEAGAARPPRLDAGAPPARKPRHVAPKITVGPPGTYQESAVAAILAPRFAALDECLQGAVFDPSITYASSIEYAFDGNHAPAPTSSRCMPEMCPCMRKPDLESPVPLGKSANGLPGSILVSFTIWRSP